MKIKNVAGARTLNGDEPRATAYYYADLERLRRKDKSPTERSVGPGQVPNPDELSEYVEVDFEEISPVRSPPAPWAGDAQQRKGETYSTAGTFPLPQPKEKEPLLAELEIVGRLPLTSLDGGPAMRRSRSWYLCCPDVDVDEDASRECSWRYSSLRPVTAPPPRSRRAPSTVCAESGEGGGDEDVAALRAERDGLARALAAERQRAASRARAQDARLAELHAVLGELVRARGRGNPIPEEQLSDECESTTQPAGELEQEADCSRTDQKSSSPASPTSPTDSEPAATPPDSSRTGTEHRHRAFGEHVTDVTERGDTSLDLSDKDSEMCLSSARWCQIARESHSSCEREHGSADGRVLPANMSPGRSSSRQAKLASRVRLKRTGAGAGAGAGGDTNHKLTDDESWCAEAAQQLALDVCAQADLREALVAAENDGEALSATAAAWKARCLRLEADCTVLQCALIRATDTAQRLSLSCAAAESWCVCVCEALRTADRALEAYDVLLALAETQAAVGTNERSAAELVARQLLSRLEAAPTEGSVESAGSAGLLSPGPWLQHDVRATPAGEWDATCEERLRAHAARLKADTVRLRARRPPCDFFRYHEEEDESTPSAPRHVRAAEMEAAVVLQEMLSAREARAATRAAALTGDTATHTTGSTKSQAARRHWLDSHAETDL